MNPTDIKKQITELLTEKENTNYLFWYKERELEKLMTILKRQQLELFDNDFRGI